MMNWNELLNGERLYRAARGVGDVRSELQRDYDRALFSSAVRRLQHKAQVFPLEPNDKVRNRLTHSHEVSCIARSMAERYVSDFAANRRIDHGIAQGIPIVCATVGLLHDLGNPPFGHAGEMAIAEWFEKHEEDVFAGILDGEDERSRWIRQDFLNFEGNAQTMRIVLKLQSILGDSGLNLTYGTLSASRKYVGRSIDVSHGVHLGGAQSIKKPGYFHTEEERIRDIVSRTCCEDIDGRGWAMRHPLTFLVEAADDIVYSTVDLEDSLSKGVVSWEMLKDEFAARVKDSKQKQVVYQVIERIDHQLKDLLLANVDSERNTIAGQLLRTQLIGVFIDSVVRSFDEHYEAIMCGDFDQELISVCDMSEIIWACKGVGNDHIYVVVSNSKLEILGRRVIHDLLSLFWDAVKKYEGKDSLVGYDGKVWRVISPNYRGLFEKWFADANDEESRQELRLHLVTDYVCGMTDHYARQLHRELMGGL